MIVLERKPELDIRTDCEAGLVVEPQDISFEDLTENTVAIRVKIRNDGSRRSEPTMMRLESAPLGAFVPWKPLAELPVSALEPGEERELSTEATRPRPKPLGSFDRVPPRTLLAAVSASPDEAAPQPAAGMAAMLALFRRRETSRAKNRSTNGETSLLAPDLWDLLGRDQPHWAGNINVFIGLKAVERHFAKSLRIYSGRPNLAMFDVGGGRSDAYAFEIAGLAADWQAALYDMTNAKSLVIGRSDTPVRERQWVESAGMLLMMLAIRPPVVCEDGNLAVHVTQRSQGKTAVVEFNLDPAAQGPGCYVA